MICPRHQLPARFERDWCLGCFAEVIERIEDRAYQRAVADERRMSALRLNSAEALLRRLGGTK